MGRKVWTFWYGSYMNPAVLAEVDVRPDAFEVARLDGYDITIAPLANLVPADGSAVYGVLAQATHAELDRLYAHARNVLGAVYLPEAVLVQTPAQAWRPALCYIASAMEPRPADPAYVDRILRPARELGFPSWYIEKLERFKP